MRQFRCQSLHQGSIEGLYMYMPRKYFWSSWVIPPEAWESSDGGHVRGGGWDCSILQSSFPRKAAATQKYRMRGLLFNRHLNTLHCNCYRRLCHYLRVRHAQLLNSNSLNSNCWLVQEISQTHYLRSYCSSRRSTLIVVIFPLSLQVPMNLHAMGEAFC
jgi:hypothetical protein